MNVAVVYPARETGGVPWFRPLRDKGTDLSQWGWTSQAHLAHPDYEVELDDNGNAVSWRGSLMNKVPRLEKTMDMRRKAMEDIVVKTGETNSSPLWTLNRGRYEGIAGSLAILRETSVQTEIQRSNERLGIS